MLKVRWLCIKKMFKKSSKSLFGSGKRSGTPSAKTSINQELSDKDIGDSDVDFLSKPKMVKKKKKKVAEKENDTTLKYRSVGFIFILLVLLIAMYMYENEKKKSGKLDTLFPTKESGILSMMNDPSFRIQ